MTHANTVAKPMPNFVAWCMERFGPGFSVSPKGPVTCEAFRAAKKIYQNRIGCRVYSPEYEAMFYPKKRS